MCKNAQLAIEKKLNWPLKIDLQIMVDTNGYSQTARTLNISPTSVKDRLARTS